MTAICNWLCPLSPRSAAKFEALEGADFDGSVVLRFPDMASAKAWYDSTEYGQFKSIRLGATLGRAVLLEGVD